MRIVATRTVAVGIVLGGVALCGAEGMSQAHDATLALTLSGAPTRRAHGDTIESSSHLLAEWHPFTGATTYELRIRQLGAPVARTVRLPGDASSQLVADLKSDTSYRVTVRAFLADGSNRTSETRVFRTATETWQLRGQGDSFERCTTIVAGGNNLPWPLRYGKGAPERLRGRVRLYYHGFPNGSIPRSAVQVAISPGPSTENPAELEQFLPRLKFGLRNPPAPTTLVAKVASYQAVPLARRMGKRVRLFFEARGADGRTRLMYLDSNDHYKGRDFHPGKPKIVETTGDYEIGGPAEPTVAVGVNGTPNDPTTGMAQARQSKIGWPTLSDWRWDGAPGTFLVITGADTCGASNDGLFYATWNGREWEVVKRQGCARPLVIQAHGPVVVHLGETRYKLYYEDRSAANAAGDKPLHLIYADGALTGLPDVVDFDDWEPENQAREVRFLWPSGRRLSAASESGLGDHAVFRPTDDPDLQFMLMNLGGLDDSSDPQAALGIGIAVLINP